MIFTLLGVTSIDPTAVDSGVPSFHQMLLYTHLFNGILPTLTTFSVGYYVVFAWACVIAAWLVYLRLVWYLRGCELDMRTVISFTILLATLAVLIPPIFSSDVVSYASFGRLAGIYHANPYTTTVSASSPGDVLVPFLYWRDISSPYGPIWTFISQFVAAGAHEGALELILRFKVLAFASVLADGGLVYLLVRERWPKQAPWAYMAFAWNPLVLIEGVMSAHNDAVILTFVLAGAWLLTRCRGKLAIGALAISSLIKYSTAPVVAVAAFRMLGREPRNRRLLLFITLSVICVGLAVISFAPYWGGLHSVMSTVEEPDRGLNNPFILALRGVLWLISGGHIWLGASLAAIGAAIVFCVWQAAVCWRYWVNSGEPWDISQELASWAATLTVFLALWPRIHTWYFFVPIGVSLAAGPRYRRLFLVILLLSILSYVSYGM